MKGGSFDVETVVNPGFCDFEKNGMVVGQRCADFWVNEGTGWWETVVSANGNDGWKDADDGHIIGDIPSFVWGVVVVKAGKTGPFSVWWREVWGLRSFGASCSDRDSRVEG